MPPQNSSFQNQNDFAGAPFSKEPAPLRRRFLWRAGIVLVPLALVSAFATFLVIAGYTTLIPTNEVVLSLFAANAVMIVLLLGLVVLEAWHLLAARRARVAGSRLHIRIVALFSVVASVPSIIMAIFATVTIERSLTPAFMQDMRGFISTTVDAANFYRQSQCTSLLRDVELTASDLSRAVTLYRTNPTVFHDYFLSRAKFLGLTVAVMMTNDGNIIERAEVSDPNLIARPDETDFQDATNAKPLCLVLADQPVFIALRPITGLDNTYLYAGRQIDPFADEFANKAANVISVFDNFENHRHNIELAFGIMYALLALIMLLSAIWLGLSFATRLVYPIRRLIRAADAVALGNLYVQVPVNAHDGDLAHLGNTFNKMTSELRVQQNNLIEANETIDERRQFTEAVLAGVPAAVIGVSSHGTVDVLNTAATRLIDEASLGAPLRDVLPELGALVDAARTQNSSTWRGQLRLTRNGQERLFNVQITKGGAARGDGFGQQDKQKERQQERRRTDDEGNIKVGYVVTLDDMTDLVSAQRSAAWADVARRIAHEIKNPLTPIQLSAERLKRRYGKVITEGRDIFDQCTDTIIRQVDDIKRMVDEFSSFARMPKARPQTDDLVDTARQSIFMMRLGFPTLTIEEELEAIDVPLAFDRRLLAQALTNLIKNSAEAIFEPLYEPASEPADGSETKQKSTPRQDGLIKISVAKKINESDGKNFVEISIADNGRGFPKDNRQSLLEPYVTTRAQGTGLGLPIVAKIIEDHGGKIFLEDGLPHQDAGGFGACVRLVLPVAQQKDGDDVLTPFQQDKSQERVSHGH